MRFNNLFTDIFQPLPYKEITYVFVNYSESKKKSTESAKN